MKIPILSKIFIFCVLLLIVRIFMTGHFSFIFLLWNLFLAWLPLWMIGKFKGIQTNAGKFLVIGLCILFLPNAPYILTDLFHLTKNLRAPMWYDLILILSFSILGLIYFLLCCEKLFQILKAYFSSPLQFKIIKILIVLSNGYGIYLGRYLRFNSWDLFTNPDGLAKRMMVSVFDPLHFKETIAVTVTFATFLYLILDLYENIKVQMNKQSHDLSTRT